MKPWQLGNTSVRSAMRIRDGLVAYSQSSIQGAIRGSEGDDALRQLLGSAGVVSLGDDASNSVGRKWRSAMGKLGFIYPKVKGHWAISQSNLGPLDCITPAGWNLIRATTVAAMQDCYLRAMAVPTHETSDGRLFSPLVWVLAILLDLERRDQGPQLSFLEIATIVQFSTAAESLDGVVDAVLQQRSARERAERKSRFDGEQLDAAAALAGCRVSTLRDYADENIRYIKATGMAVASGRGIALAPDRRRLACRLAGRLIVDAPVRDQIFALCNEPALPTDDDQIARDLYADLQLRARDAGISDVPEIEGDADAVRINNARFALEERLSRAREVAYAQRQAEEWRDIACYMDALSKGARRASLVRSLGIRQNEASAYLEWTLWRSMLAIGGMENAPYEARRFKVDQDFLPIGTAPGNGSDLVIEFSDFLLAVEVTLAEGSRQEAMEGEPVRRHVALLAEQSDKPVFGLFVANRIDTNTAETFRHGVWYGRQDERFDLSVVPLTLRQFRGFFCSLFKGERDRAQGLRRLLEECFALREGLDAPAWKSALDARMSPYASER